MKLFLMWLLGVPLLVASMVMAQSMAEESQRVAKSGRISQQLCSPQVDLHDVGTAIAQQGYGISCDRFSVQ
jgi:hypothetical protein